MEFLLMSDEMIDPSSFLDEETPEVGSDLNWGSWNSVNNSSTAMGKKRKHFEESQNLLAGTNKTTIATSQGKSTSKIQRREASSSNHLNSWQQEEDLEDNLASDLDGTCSLAALGVDLNSTSYNNISDALLALPSLTVFKQELPSPTNNSNGGTCISPIAVDSSNSRLTDSSSSPENSPNHIQQLYTTYDSGISESESRIVGTKNNKFSPQHNGHNNKSSLVVASAPATSTGSPPLQISDDCRFQYVLAAATSIATKVNEETLTYLNQGQSYEIRLKKLGDLSDFRGKMLKSVIRLCFHERRLQFMEREQIAAWEASRPGDRIVEVDLPLSYGMFELVQDPLMLNTVEFLWDPTKDVGVYIKVNCISTEFTPNKHGGEKGVPFRIQVETYMHGDKLQRRLHSASCQIKVFKLKGADRKHKQDKVKIQKRPLCEKEKFQPSYDCTVLNDLPNTTDCVFGAPIINNSSSSSPMSVVSPATEPIRGLCSSRPNTSPSREETVSELVTSPLTNVGQPNVLPERDMIQDFTSNSLQIHDSSLPYDATAQQTSTWLQSHRFSAHLRTFSSYSGADLLRLSRDDLIQICGLADGIRLFNALHTKAKTVYMCVQSSPTVYHAIFLANLSCREMTTKIALLLGITSAQIHNVYILGPSAIHVLISDELVLNIKDGATYAIEMIQDSSSDRLSILLKPTNH